MGVLKIPVVSVMLFWLHFLNGYIFLELRLKFLAIRYGYRQFCFSGGQEFKARTFLDLLPLLLRCLKGTHVVSDDGCG